ncbi:hypothetical protein SCYAM73S_01179 [Streptomyces cyaneofuscatus]
MVVSQKAVVALSRAADRVLRMLRSFLVCRERSFTQRLLALAAPRRAASHTWPPAEPSGNRSSPVLSAAPRTRRSARQALTCCVRNSATRSEG